MGYVETHSCSRGQQLDQGQCVPTPSLVFQRCMASLRTSTIEHDRGRDFGVGASVDTRTAQLAHERRDRERTEYAGLADADLETAIHECRRQEQAERDGQIARAWDETERARGEAERARLDAVAARVELKRERASKRNAGETAFASLPTVDEVPSGGGDGSEESGDVLGDEVDPQGDAESDTDE